MMCQRKITRSTNDAWQARNQDFFMGGGVHFDIEVDLAIIFVMKQSDFDYQVNKVVKCVVTVSSHG